MVISQKKFEPFKPNIYETELEKAFLTLDIVRLVLNISLALVHAVLGFLNIRKFCKTNTDDYTPVFSLLFDLVVLAVFIG